MSDITSETDPISDKPETGVGDEKSVEPTAVKENSPSDSLNEKTSTNENKENQSQTQVDAKDEVQAESVETNDATITSPQENTNTHNLTKSATGELDDPGTPLEDERSQSPQDAPVAQSKSPQKSPTPDSSVDNEQFQSAQSGNDDNSQKVPSVEDDQVPSENGEASQLPLAENQVADARSESAQMVEQKTDSKLTEKPDSPEKREGDDAQQEKGDDGDAELLKDDAPETKMESTTATPDKEVSEKDEAALLSEENESEKEKELVKSPVASENEEKVSEETAMETDNVDKLEEKEELPMETDTVPDESTENVCDKKEILDEIVSKDSSTQGDKIEETTSTDNKVSPESENKETKSAESPMGSEDVSQDSTKNEKCTGNDVSAAKPDQETTKNDIDEVKEKEDGVEKMDVDESREDAEKSQVDKTKDGDSADSGKTKVDTKVNSDKTKGDESVDSDKSKGDDKVDNEEKANSVEDTDDTKETKSEDKTGSGKIETEKESESKMENQKDTKTEKDNKIEDSIKSEKIEEDEDPDVTIIEDVKVQAEVVNLIDDDDEEEDDKKKSIDNAIVNNNETGLQISSVSSGITMPVDDKPVEKQPSAKSESSTKSQKQKTPQVCIVCNKVCKCKYNIVRNGDIKHLCDDNCFKRFRSNPTAYLKSTKAEKGVDKSVSNGGVKSKQVVKTCHVCQLMNINTNKQFCNWHGLDFCDEGCLQKFQNNLNTSCSLCTEVIPVNNRGLYVFKISSTDIRTLCSQKCLTEFRKLIRLCTYCNKDLSNCPDSFSAPVGATKTFHEFCSQDCMSKYEKEQNAPEVEIMAVTPGSVKTPSACAVCTKSCIPLHTVKLNNVLNKLCSAPCLQAFQYANKLALNKCENCGKVCSSEETKSFFIQYEGNQKKFCSDRCVETFRNANQKVVPCAWCGSKKRNFDMIERVDSNNKYQLFCTLNCLSLYRVNLQAKSNLCVSCDHCRKYTPAQYHLTMSDASVRNFCSYNCVMSFQRQFTSGVTSSITPNTSNKGAVKVNTRGSQPKQQPQQQQQQQQTGQPAIPIISNVVSLAPPGQKQQTVNIKTTNQVPVVLAGQKTPVTVSSGTQAVQQQIIVQPPPPKIMKNKSLLCKPFVQTKATSCRPSTQNKKIGTEEVEPTKPVLIPVPVPIYVPTPLAMYSNPTPMFFPVPVPIPVPIFIPTTKKSADKILKQIKEIQNKIPADPLEAELLMMAEAVAGDKGSSDSDSDHSDKEDDLPPFIEDIDEKTPILAKGKDGGEEDMLQMAIRVAEEISEPIMDLEANVEPVAVKTDPPSKSTQPRQEYVEEEEAVYVPQPTRSRRGSKRASRGRSTSNARAKRQKIEEPEVEPPPPALLTPAQPPEDANSYLKFTYGVNAWKHWVVFKNNQLEKVSKVGSGKLKLFKTDLLQCTADELNYSLCLFCKEVRKPNGEEYSPDSIYYLCLGIQQYLYESGRVDNIFSDFYYEKFAECLSEVLSNHQPKLNAAGQMLCRIEEEHLWEAKQLGAHSPYVLLNTLIYFHTKYFMMKTPQEHMNMSFTQILKHWRKGGPGKPTTANTAGRSVTLRYYCMGPGGATGKPKSKEGIPVYETSENLENPLRCPVKLYEFYLSKCPESIKNVNDMFYLVPERSCVPDSPVWYSTQSLALELMTKMLNRILLVREIQEAHLHAQPIYV